MIDPYFLGEINDVAAYEKLYNDLQNGVLKELGALDVADEDMDGWCKRLRDTIMTLSPMEALLQRCHEHKVENVFLCAVCQHRENQGADCHLWSR